jgi:hypothetical protein
LSDVRYRTQLSLSCCLPNVLFCEVHTGSISFPSRIRPKRAVCHHREMAPYLARRIGSNQTCDVEERTGALSLLDLRIESIQSTIRGENSSQFSEGHGCGTRHLLPMHPTRVESFQTTSLGCFHSLGLGRHLGPTIRRDQLCRTNGLSRWARNRRGDVQSWHTTLSVVLLPA